MSNSRQHEFDFGDGFHYDPQGQPELPPSATNRLNKPSSSSSSSDRIPVELKDGESAGHQRWRPATLKTPFLITVITICLSFVGLIEFLLHQSNKYGGLVFADEKTGELPSYALFVFEYLPTLVAVFHSLIWVYIDHDIRRIEAFFQLSKKDGASAKNSLLLDYSYQFAVLVPFTSFRNRHWVVFCSGVLALLGAYIATPLMSAILTQENIVRSIDFEAGSRTILPFNEQSSQISAQFTHLLYRYKYLNDSLPRFTNENTGVLPFVPLGDTFATKPGETWTTDTFRYEADLDCTEAVQTLVSNGRLSPGSGLKLSNGRDCSYTFVPATYSPELEIDFNLTAYSAIFMGKMKWGFTVTTGEFLQDSAYSLSNSSECSNTNVFLAVFNKFSAYEKDGKLLPIGPERNTTLNSVPNNATAVFCEPRYYSQQVRATVDASSGLINSTIDLGARMPFDEFINSTFFETLLVTGENPTTTPNLNVLPGKGNRVIDPFGVPDISKSILAKKKAFQYLTDLYGEQNSATARLNFQMPVGKMRSRMNGPGFQNLIPYAISETERLDDYLTDPKKFGEDLAKAYKMFFAFALTDELSTAKEQEQRKMIVTRKFVTKSYIVDPLWARLLQGTFGVLILLDLFITYLLWGRPLNLSCDPGSLASLMASISSSSALLSDFRGSEFIPFKQTVRKVKNSNRRYQLHLVEGSCHRLDKISVAYPDQEMKPFPHEPTTYEKEGKKLDAARPWELSIITGAIIIMVFLGLTGLFSGLWVLNRKHDGLSRLSNKTFVRNLAFSYGPTISATLIETFLVAVARFVSLIMPFEEMRRAPTKQEKSLAIAYESRPPHFLLMRALNKGHFLLAGLIISVILANVLAVALGGLFLSHTTQSRRPVEFAQLKEPLINGSRFNHSAESSGAGKSIDMGLTDIYYPAARSVDGDKLPAWTTQEWYVVPFSWTKDNVPTNRTAKTIAFAADISCNPVTPEQVNETEWSTQAGEVGASIEKRIYPVGLCENVPNAIDRGNSSETDQYISTVVGYGVQSLSKLALQNGVPPQGTRTLWWENFSQISHCPGIFSFGAVKYTVENVTVEEGSNGYSLRLVPVRQTALLCKTGFKAASAEVTVNDAGQVLSIGESHILDQATTESFIVNTPKFEMFRPNDPPLKKLDWGVIDMFNSGFQSYLMGGESVDPGFKYDSRPDHWVSYLMTKYSPSLADTGLDSNATEAARTLEKAYKFMFAIFLQTKADDLFRTESSSKISGFEEVTAERMRVSKSMFILAILLLTSFTILLGIVYIIRPGKFLNHIPTTLAATIPHVYASTMLEDLKSAQRLDKRSLARYLGELDYQYGYGWFWGRDGEAHIGVDREPVLRRENAPEWGQNRGSHRRELEPLSPAP